MEEFGFWVRCLAATVTRLSLAHPAIDSPRNRFVYDHPCIRLFACLVLVFVATTAGAVEDEKPRLWTDATGKFKVTATLAGNKGRRVVLQKLDGTTITLSPDALSVADRTYLAEKAKAESEPAPRTDRGRSRPRPAAVKSTSSPTAFLVTPSSPAPALRLDGPVYPLDATERPKPIVIEKAQPQPIPNLGNGFVHRLGNFTASLRTSRTLLLDAEQGIFGISVEALDYRSGKTFIGRSSRQKSERTTPRPVPGLACSIRTLSGAGQGGLYQGTDGILLVDHHQPTGRTLVFCDMAPLADSSEISIMTGLGGSEVKKVARWRFPAASIEIPQTMQSRLVGDDLLMIPVDDKLVVWSIESGNCLYQIELEYGTSFAASPCGEFLAVTNDEGCHLFAAATGAPLGLIPMELTVKGVEFSPDSRRLAMLDMRTTLVWDMVAGAIDYTSPNPKEPRPLFGGWMSNSLLLTSDALFDVDRRMAIWRYQFPKVFAAEPGCLISNLGSRAPVISCFPVPHAGAAAVIQRLDQLQEEAFVLQPGDAVSLKVSVPRLMNQDAALQQLTALAEALGLRPDPSAKKTITATFATLRNTGPVMFSDDRDRKSFARAPYQQVMLTLQVGKRVLWTQSFTDSDIAQRELPLPDNMSAERAATRMPPMSLERFQDRIPKRMLRPDVAQMIGRSEIRNDRWQDVR